MSRCNHCPFVKGVPCAVSCGAEADRTGNRLSSTSNGRTGQEDAGDALAYLGGPVQGARPAVDPAHQVLAKAREQLLQDSIRHLRIQRSFPDILQAMADTARERNAIYRDNYKMVAPIIRVLFPDGVPTDLVTSDKWHLFELVIVKITRFACSDLTHADSIHDAGVYAAMVEMCIEHEQDEIK